jgi:hypothetical protein
MIATARILRAFELWSPYPMTICNTLSTSGALQRQNPKCGFSTSGTSPSYESTYPQEQYTRDLA